ncbi:hypothetical protein [Nocardioides sp. SYSU DS0663]|uniref:hypothetical protein n=1 Tax=Nocardioides sp. SYSU DS0663 TaxID=3416445 RepID=UPI003F4C976F
MSTLSPLPPHRHAAIRRMLVEHVTADVDAAPQAARISRRVGWSLAGASTVAAATAVGAVVLVATDPTAPPSYASWTAVPETAPGATVTDEDAREWASRCTDLGVGGLTLPSYVDRPGPGDVLVDRRGDFTYCVDIHLGAGTGTHPLVALSGVRADGGPELTHMSATVFDQPYEVPTGGEVLSLNQPMDTPDEPDQHVLSLDVHHLMGLAGPEVRAVDIVLSNGLRITTTLDDGRWAAWWPDDRGPASGAVLEVRTATSTRIVTPAEVDIFNQ